MAHTQSLEALNQAYMWCPWPGLWVRRQTPGSGVSRRQELDLQFRVTKRVRRFHMPHNTLDSSLHQSRRPRRRQSHHHPTSPAHLSRPRVARQGITCTPRRQKARSSERQACRGQRWGLASRRNVAALPVASALHMPPACRWSPYHNN